LIPFCSHIEYIPIREAVGLVTDSGGKAAVYATHRDQDVDITVDLVAFAAR
jgi:hypothetical protein